MAKYHKIDSVFKRDPAARNRFILGDYAKPEFELLRDIEWVWTEKIDGTNIRIGWDGVNVKIGGKTDTAQLPSRLVNWLVTHFTSKLLLSVFGPTGGLTLYGEGYGAGIQSGGGYNTDGEQRVILFDILAKHEQEAECWFRRDDVDMYANQLGVACVPIVGSGTISQAIEFVREPRISPCGTCRSEGIVLRPKIELCNRFGTRIITKLKYSDFAD